MSNRSARAAEEISREMGLTIANDVHKQKQYQAEHADSTRQAIKERLQRIAYRELGKGHRHINDFLDALHQQGVGTEPVKNQQGKTYGLRFEYAGQTFKASEIGREFGYRSLLNQFGITTQGQKGTSKVPRYPVQRQTPEPQQRQEREQQQAPSLGALLLGEAANAVGSLFTPTGNNYDPVLADWYEAQKRKKKKKKGYGISR